MKKQKKIIELNDKGNFSNWEASKLSEMKQFPISTEIGRLGYQDKLVKFWNIILPSFERLAFRLQKRSFTVTSTVKGMMISRNISGQVVLFILEKGDSYSCCSQLSELIFEIENIGKKDLKFTIVEHLAHS